MTTKNSIIVGIALVVGIVIGAVLFTSSTTENKSLGGTVQTNLTQFVNGFTAGKTNQFAVSNAGVISSSGGIVASSTVTGTNGTSITKVIEGTFTNTSCTGAATQAATTTTTYSCTVTGAAALDRVWITLASTTPYGAYVSSAYASTTASNNIRLVIGNASTTAVAATTTGAFYRVTR